MPTRERRVASLKKRADKGDETAIAQLQGLGEDVSEYINTERRTNLRAVDDVNADESAAETEDDDVETVTEDSNGQGRLPGHEVKRDRRVTQLAKDYRDKRDARIAANKLEKESYDALDAVLKEKGIDFYEFEDFEVTVDETRKVHVNKKKSAAEREKRNEKAATDMY